MGEVAVSMTVSLESPETNTQKVLDEIKEKVDVRDSSIEEVGFGVKKIKIMVVFDDREGGNTDKIENEISSISGVSNVEAGEAALI